MLIAKPIACCYFRPRAVEIACTIKGVGQGRGLLLNTVWLRRSQVPARRVLQPQLPVGNSIERLGLPRDHRRYVC